MTRVGRLLKRAWVFWRCWAVQASRRVTREQFDVYRGLSNKLKQGMVENENLREQLAKASLEIAALTEDLKRGVQRTEVSL